MATRLYQFIFIQHGSAGTIEKFITFTMEKSHPLPHEEEICIFKQLAEENGIDRKIFRTHCLQSIGPPYGH